MTEAPSRKHQKYHIVPSKPRSELEQFAMSFGQDWRLMFASYREGAARYFESLPKDRELALRRELAVFVGTNAGRKGAAVKKAWLKLGTEGWEPDLDLVAMLKAFAG